MTNATADTLQRVNVDTLARLPLFSHAVRAGDFIFVSGTLGTRGSSLELVPGGIGPQTVQALRNVETILKECGASLADLVQVNVLLADEKNFQAMNQAYREVIGDVPPARITYGRLAIAFDAAVEIDAIAYRPRR